MIIKKCQQCEKIFEIWPYRKDIAKFCSSQCRSQWMLGKPNKSRGVKRPQSSGRNHPMYGRHHTLEAKTKMSEALKGRVAWNKGKSAYWCKEMNSPNWKGGKVKQICLYCKKEFQVWPHKIKNNEGKFCSRSCASRSRPAWNKGLKRWWESPGSFKKQMIPWNKGLKGYNAGKKHPQWKGGITPIIKKIRNSWQLQEWRKRVFEYDDYTCWICGKRGTYLHAHHLKRFRDYPQLRFKSSNGITLCEFCHKIYTEYGNKLD